MPVADIKLLRDQLAQVIGENKRQAAKLKENETKNAELTLTVNRIILEMGLIKQGRDEALAKVELLEKALREATEGNIKVERILEYYDNPHTPPRNRAITQREINRQKKEERKKNNPTGRKGRHKGCKNTAVGRKATRTIRHRPDKCGGCGSPNLEAVRTDNKIVLDIPDIPQMEVVNHRTDTCRCLDCGRETAPKTGLVRGTSLGPNLLKMVIGLWKMNGSYQGIADLFSDLFGVDGCVKSTIQHARDAVTDRMCPEAGGIAARMAAKKSPMGMDETPVQVPSGTGQAWLAADEDSTLVRVEGSRGEAVLREHFPFFERPLTADGYRPYRNLFGTLQRCWAHISRESRSHVRIAEMRSGVSSTDCRDAQARHDRLILVYHQAKGMGSATPGTVRGARAEDRPDSPDLPRKAVQQDRRRGALPVHLPSASEHVAYQQPLREGAAPDSPAPQGQRPDRQHQRNAQVRHTVHVPADLAQAKAQHLPRAGPYLDSSDLIHSEPKRVPPFATYRYNSP